MLSGGHKATLFASHFIALDAPLQGNEDKWVGIYKFYKLKDIKQLLFDYADLITIILCRFSKTTMNVDRIKITGQCFLLVSSPVKWYFGEGNNVIM